MIDGVFVFGLAVIFLGLLTWAFKTLPKERWQIIASVPLKKEDSGHWTGVNLTFYGVFLASAYLFGVVIFLILLGALGVNLMGVMYLIIASLVFCVPSSWLLAVVVERKKHTFTVGGAVLVGLLTAPAVIVVVRFLADTPNLELMPALAAMCISYSVGEGLGRLACISFGCCYGKPIDQFGTLARRLFSRIGFIFDGHTKKISYESGLDGVKVVPIQAITAILLLASALVSIIFFLNGSFHLAFALSIFFSQAWRVFSETLRADFRGGKKFSAYQRMALAAIIYATFLLVLVPAPQPILVDLVRGLMMLWQPSVILVLESIWLGLFIVTGCSMVTKATLSFHVRRERT